MDRILRGLLALLAMCGVLSAVPAVAGRSRRAGALLHMRHRRFFLEEIRLPLQRGLGRPLFGRPVQGALGVDAARSLTHS